MQALNRRHFGVALSGALLTSAAFASGNGGADSELVRLGQTFDMDYLAYRSAWAAWQEAHDAYYHRDRRPGADPFPLPADKVRFRAEVLMPRSETLNGTMDRIEASIEAASRLRFSTIAGVRAKARMLPYEMQAFLNPMMTPETETRGALVLDEFLRELDGIAPTSI